jgi:hypothetical protein
MTEENWADHQEFAELEVLVHLMEPVARVSAPLPELAPSPWRSLGKRLDYSTWQDRERFLELDAAILVRERREALTAF